MFKYNIHRLSFNKIKNEDYNLYSATFGKTSLLHLQRKNHKFEKFAIIVLLFN